MICYLFGENLSKTAKTINPAVYENEPLPSFYQDL